MHQPTPNRGRYAQSLYSLKAHPCNRRLSICGHRSSQLLRQRQHNSTAQSRLQHAHCAAPEADEGQSSIQERIDAALLQNSLSASDTRKDGKSGQPVTLNRHLPERALSPQRGTVHNSPRGIEQVNDSGTVQGGTKRARFRVVEQKMGSTDNQSTSARLQLLREGPRPPEIQ